MLHKIFLFLISRMGAIAHRRRKENRKSETLIGFRPHCRGRVSDLVISQTRFLPKKDKLLSLLSKRDSSKVLSKFYVNYCIFYFSDRIENSFSKS
jgi:hypothetical protein